MGKYYLGVVFILFVAFSQTATTPNSTPAASSGSETTSKPNNTTTNIANNSK